MAAVTTKKPGADTGVALTFPTVYEYTYADEGRGERFAHEAPLPRTEEMPGGLDLQDDYHQQKYLDARAMAFAALASRRSADKRMLLSHANYFGMPAPVLSQRRFANPSLGNQSGAIDSARRTMADDGAPFHCVSMEGGALTVDTVNVKLKGGVLRSAEGQRYGRSLLQRRVKQLDAIDAADATFSETTSVAPLSDAYPVKAQIELVTAMDRLRAALTGDQATATRFILDDFSRLVSEVRRAVLVASPEQLEDALTTLVNVRRVVRVVPGARGAIAGQPAQNAARFGELVDRRLEQLERFLGAMYQYTMEATRSPAERRAFADNIIRTVGLTTTMLRRPPAMADMGFPRRRLAVRGRVAAEFDRPAGPREDAEAAEVDAGAGAGARRFARDERQRFGQNAGAFFGEAGPAGDAAPAAAAAVPPPPAGRGRGRGRASNPMRKDRSNRMSVAAATREAPLPAFASLLGRRGR